MLKEKSSALYNYIKYKILSLCYRALIIVACFPWLHYQQYFKYLQLCHRTSDILNAKHLFTPIRFSQIAKPRSKPLALGVDVVRPQWQAASTGVSIISFPESSQAILLKLLDACKLLTAAVNTSLQTLNQLPNLIDDRGCEDVPAVAGMYTDYAFPLCHIF